jgi:hypothetical protein
MHVFMFQGSFIMCGMLCWELWRNPQMHPLNTCAPWQCIPAMMLSTALAAEQEHAMVVALDKKSTVLWASLPLCQSIGWQRSKFEGRTVKCMRES